MGPREGRENGWRMETGTGREKGQGWWKRDQGQGRKRNVEICQGKGVKASKDHGKRTNEERGKVQRIMRKMKRKGREKSQGIVGKGPEKRKKKGQRILGKKVS
jgi:hypothetical protein